MPTIVAALLAWTLSSTAPLQTPPRLLPLDPPIGCATCDGPEAFGSIQGLGVGVDGTVVVADRDPPHIRIFGPDGSVRTTFGRSGRGPGEFGTPGGVALLEDGRVAAADFRWTHVAVFATDGEVVRSYDVESTTSRLMADPTGRWVSWQVADWATMSAGVSLLGPDGSTSVPLPSTLEHVLNGEGEAAALGVFATAPGPDGRVAVGTPDIYHFLVLRPDGSILHEIERNIPRTERTDGEIAELEEAFRRGPAGRAGNPEGAARPRVDPFRPHFWVDGVAYDSQARLWVQTARGGPGRSVLDIFSADGEWLGELPLDVELETFTIGGDVLAGVVEDPTTGVQRVMRWRIEG